MKTLRKQKPVITELLAQQDYNFVMTGWSQCDPVKRGFSQMSGRWFLVGQREFLNSGCILKCNSLIKAQVNFWDEDLKKEDSIQEVLNEFLEME